MIDKVYIFHEEKNYFGQPQTFESELRCPYEERILKALDKFARRLREGGDDVLHIATDDRHYVICKSRDGGMEWFYWYGPQGNKSAAIPCTPKDVRRMVRKEFEEV